MNAPPEANSEYSRGSGAFGGLLGPRRPAATASAAPGPQAAGTARTALALAGLLGALLVLVAQFTALYHLHSANSSVPIKIVGTGANHAWAPVPLALVAAAAAYAVYRHASRSALVGLAVLGIATLLIALLGDLPGAHSSGLIGSSASGYVQATSSPSAGLYMETLGAIVLLVVGGVGLLMLTPADDQPDTAPADGRPDRAPGDGQPDTAPADGRPDMAPGDGRPDTAPADGQPDVAPTRSPAPTRPILVVDPARTHLDLRKRKPDH